MPRRVLLEVVLLSLLVLFLTWLSFPAISVGPVSSPALQEVSSARQLGTILSTYAFDHDFKYPTGSSSTEVFQQLIDEGYLTQEGAGQLLFISGMPGKTPYSGEGPLQPENVCYDVIAPVTHEAHDTLPLLISTGWEIPAFKKGVQPVIRNQGQATAVAGKPGKWWGWEPGPPGLVVFRKGFNATFLKFYPTTKQFAHQQQFFPGELDPEKASAYRQLRP